MKPDAEQTRPHVQPHMFINSPARRRMNSMQSERWAFHTGIFAALCLVGCAEEATPIVGVASDALDGRNGNQYVNYHRDRLLATYATYKGLGTPANAWNSLNAKQHDLFLIETDLLGNRSYFANTISSYVGRSCNGGSINCSNGCEAIAPGVNEYCVYYPSGQACQDANACTYSVSPRNDFTMALEHVSMMYEVLAPNGSCGGDDNNRIFWRADDPLIQNLRNMWMGLPEWDRNDDLGGPHGPFNNASATISTRPFSCDGPDGQAQFYSYDDQAVAFSRGSTSLPADGHMFEL